VQQRKQDIQKRKHKSKFKGKANYKDKSDGFLLCDLMRFSRIKEEEAEDLDRDEPKPDFTSF